MQLELCIGAFDFDSARYVLGRSFYSNGFRTLAKGHPNMDALVAWQLQRPFFIVSLVLITFLWGMSITPTNFIMSR